MGTRNLTCVVKNGEYKVAHYCQWDGGPKGQGLDVLGFLTHLIDRNIFEENLEKLFWITKDEAKQQWIEAGVNKEDKIVSEEIMKKHMKMFPESRRDIGAQILNLIQNSKRPLGLVNEIGFAKDSMSCEWAYVLDLDRDTLEIYCGDNTKPLNSGDRFFFLQNLINLTDKYGGPHYPIKMVKSYHLDRLPSEEEFLLDLKIKED